MYRFDFDLDIVYAPWMPDWVAPFIRELRRKLHNLRVAVFFKPGAWFRMQMYMRTLANDPERAHMVIPGTGPIEWVLDRIYFWFYAG